MAGGSRFRLPFKRRKYYHRSNRDQPMITTQVSSLINPFDSKNGQPKWPDGLATYSIGRRHQLTTEIYNDDFWVILFPGAINWCVAFASENDLPYIYANHTANISINYEYNESLVNPEIGVTPDPNSTAHELHVAHDAFSHWRNVATAVHLQVINTTDTNEGWFRAARINRTREFEKFFDVIGGVGSAYGNGNHILETPHFHVGGLLPGRYLMEKLNEMLDNEPSLCCGELQDIHNAVFQLNNIKDRNPFKQLRTETLYSNEPVKTIYKRDDPISQEELFAIDQYFLKFGGQAYTRSRSEYGLLSDSKDIVLIHVLGGPKTKILLHSVNNQEFLCPDNSQLAQYVTPCQNDKPGLQRYNDNRANYHKFPYHYIANFDDTEKAIPGPYWMSEPWHYYG
jgi:hypothetical protein